MSFDSHNDSLQVTRFHIISPLAPIISTINFALRRSLCLRNVCAIYWTFSYQFGLGFIRSYLSSATVKKFIANQQFHQSSSPHTILGSRSRFVWLCVQVNHDELLKTFMKIAKYAQLNFYKGIGSMRFMYGRLGYKKE